MAKKAGPKRIDPDTFRPMVWSAEGSTTSFLVCSRRWLRGAAVIGKPEEVAAHVEWFSHAVAIQLSPDLEIVSGLRVNELKWSQSEPERHGISTRCAQVALAEVWHGVKATLDLATMSAHVSSRMQDWSEHKRGVRLRNVVAALCWDRWNAEGLTLDGRAERLAHHGIKCTALQLARFAEDRGFPG